MYNGEVEILESQAPADNFGRGPFVDEGEVAVIAIDDKWLPPEQRPMEEDTYN